MKISNIQILSEKELSTLSNENDKNCFCTDLARIMGANFDKTTGFGEYWIDSTQKTNSHGQNISVFVNVKGQTTSTKKIGYKAGVRIAISFDDIEDLNSIDLDNMSIKYPITNIGGRIRETIDKLFATRSKLILKTGEKHLVGDNLYDEYEVFGIKFIKFNNNQRNLLLSDGTVDNSGNVSYLKVEDIPLIPNNETRMIYSPYILFASTLDKNCREFSKSTLKEYLNGPFLKYLNGELYKNNEGRTVLYGGNSINNTNRYNFNVVPLTEEEIMEICINSHISVFLHGKTGSGKTERVVALDNDLELVDFGCTSAEGFTGIIAKDFNSKELCLYEPYWYKNIVSKCEKEPDYLHLLFLEELLNAKNDVQKVAFEVTLNKTLTNSGFRLELPKNCVVVAAGNEANESKSANEMSEPLFGRFAHVYINTDSESWLRWALNRKKEGKKLLYKEVSEHHSIHPAIIDFVRINGDRVLRTNYNGITPNADPRKWALASRALYECNNPNVLRAFIGEELTQEFIRFCQMNIITIDDIINNRIKPEEVSSDPSIRWYSVICLSSVDDENVGIVRDFIRELGHEYLALFDYKWSKGNDDRIMKLYSDTIDAHKRKLV